MATSCLTSRGYHYRAVAAGASPSRECAQLETRRVSEEAASLGRVRANAAKHHLHILLHEMVTGCGADVVAIKQKLMQV